MTTINKIAKIGVLSSLLMSSVALKASNPITNTNKTQNQTEVVSKEGAEALKSISIQSVQQTAIPSVHNSRIDNTFRKYATNEDEKKYINSLIEGIYENKGTFLASALLQHELDRQQIFLLLEENGDLLTKNNLNPDLGEKIKKFGSDFYKSVRPNAKKVGDWLDNHYSPTITALLEFDHKPTADEVIKRLDYIAENKVNFSKDEFNAYLFSSGMNNKNNKSKEIAQSDIIAKRIFLLDFMIIKKSLKNCNFFGENSKFDKFSELADYYTSWMNTVAPDSE